MRQVLFSNEVRLEDERVMKLDYCLTEKLSDTNQKPYYGVSISKVMGDLSESDEVAGISESRETVEAIIKMLFQFKVTPVSMVNIVDDLVTQGI